MIRIYDLMRSSTVPAAIAVAFRCDRHQHPPWLFQAKKVIPT
ncbi:hypothetical protein [Geitlerinema sp. P-1104]|nr:hypothetical protein [Geitlerinema sp. P-1104]